MTEPPAGPEGMDEDDPHAEGAAVVAAAGEALQALCQELNLDEGSAAEALDDFTAIRGNYSLEVSGGRWGGGTELARPHPRPAPTPPCGAVGVSPPGRVSAQPGAEECEAGREGIDPISPFILRRETEFRKRSGFSKVTRHSGVVPWSSDQRRRRLGTALKSL